MNAPKEETSTEANPLIILDDEFSFYGSFFPPASGCFALPFSIISYDKHEDELGLCIQPPVES